VSTVVEAPRVTTAGHDPRPAPPRRRVLAALARIEAARVARHPGLLLGIVGGLAVLPTVSTANALAGTELLVLGILSFLIGFLNVDRGRRDDTIELLDSLPVPSSVRTGAVLVSMAVAAAVAAAIALTSWLLVIGADGEVVHEGLRVRPNPLDAVQGPVLTAVFGLTGACLGRWTGRPVLAPLLMLTLLIGPVGWSIPWVVYGTEELVPGDWVLGNPGWHLLFLTGVCATTSAAALLRDSRARAWWLLLAAGLAALTLGAALQ
jgi:hypothetical protein